jgi:hypothetical protein
MDNLARKIENDPVFQEIGTIVATRGAAFVIRSASDRFEAERAASCLLAPEVGDRVLCAGSRREGHYVLAILTRAEGTKAAVSVDGDLELRVPSGRFVVAAQEGVELISGKDTAVVSGSVSITAAEASVGVERLSLLGSFVRAEIESVKLLAGKLDSVVERVSARLKRSFRTVEETDQVRAARIDYAAQSTMSLHAENALVTASELVKVDGEQIHVG